ncbi:MAG TPA: bifunctional pyr operon transcriptional regulator/uracil phosphoribosyltransferase PyrR [Polyangiaceae bacterium]|nr:bifunctional pyr operon transcriptional regulator/uracil phosphoribosyltransferase PyrR [Polyangiaceae bacterium]
MRTLLDAADTASGIAQMARQIAGRHGGTADLILIGVRRGGIPVMQALAQQLERSEQRHIKTGSVDITLYRDDVATALPNPRMGASEIPYDINGKRVLLVDDVAHTRRTTRAALDAILDYGRPRVIEFAVLIDRDGGELPIQPDYRVLQATNIAFNERIDVITTPAGLSAVVQLVSSPSIPPHYA